MKSCKLCQRIQTLRKSHVIPEFLFKPTYDDKHRVIKFRRKPATRQYEQKGFRDYLLCDDCERLLNDNYEKYANSVLFSQDYFDQKICEPFFWVKNLDYTKFKLFHLSILYRAHVSEVEFFCHISLPPKISERIRLMLIDQNPGNPCEFPIMGCVIEKNNRICSTMIMQPLPRKKDGCLVYLFLYGGILWHFFVTTQGDPSLAIDLKGEIPLLVQNWRDFEPAKSFFLDHIKTNRKELNVI